MILADEEGVSMHSPRQREAAASSSAESSSIFRNMITVSSAAPGGGSVTASAASSSSSSSRAAAVLDIAQETESSLKSYCTGLSASHGIHISRADVEREVLEMREGSYDKPVPEVALLRSIVRRFIDVANAVKSVSSRIPPSPSATAASSSATGLGDSKDISALLRLIEGHADSDDLVGWASAYRGIFLLRCASALLSLVAFVVMSNVHPLLIGRSRLFPSEVFTAVCTVVCSSGSFDLRAYRAALSLAVITYVYCLACVLYYLLPLDRSGSKYVPGLEGALDSDSVAARYIEQARARIKMHSKDIELYADAALLITTLVVVLTASILLERGAKLLLSGGGYSGAEVLFTLGTFYDTFVNTSPACIARGANTTNLIRASLSMMYLNLGVLALCMRASLRSCLLQRARGSEAGRYVQVGRQESLVAGGVVAREAAAEDDVVDVDL